MAICPVCNTEVKESKCYVCNMEILEADLISINDIKAYKNEIENKKNQRNKSFVSSEERKNVLLGYTGKDEYVKIPDTYTVIGDGCFRDAPYYSSIKTVFIPKSVVSINSSSLVDSNQPANNGAFAFCENLETVVLEDGSSLSEIGILAFYNCKNLKRIEGLEKTTGTVRIDSGAFSRCNKELIKQLITLGKNYPGKFIFDRDWSE